MSSGSAPVAKRTFDLQGGDAHQVVGEHGGADQQLETLDALGQAALHAAPAEQHGDAALDAGPEALALLEVGRLFTGFALRSSRAAGLWDAHQLDAAVLAQRQVPFAEEAAIRSVQLGNTAERPLVALQRSADMLLVGWIAFEHLVLRDQAPDTLGKKDLVAELDRRAYLAALDQVGV